jgi:hypothetical protein
MKEVDAVFCQGPKKSVSRIGAGPLSLAGRSRPWQAHAEAHGGSAARIVSLSPRAVVPRPAVPSPSRTNAQRMRVTLLVPPLLSPQAAAADAWRQTAPLSGPPPMRQATTSALPHTVPPLPKGRPASLPRAIARKTP